jgi:hypothetical protein
MGEVPPLLQRARRACIQTTRWRHTSTALLTDIFMRERRLYMELLRCMPEANDLTRTITAAILIARQLDRPPCARSASRRIRGRDI